MAKMCLGHWLLALFLLQLTPNVHGFEFDSELLSGHGMTDPGGLEALQVMKDELQSLRMELTKSFIAEHSRKKREVLGYKYEVSLNTKSTEDYFETRTESVGYSSCVYNNRTYVFQSNGIYELEGLRQSSQYEPSGSRPSLTKLASWTLDRGERVLSTYDWEGKLFILTSSQNGSYCKLYTVQGPDFTLILRQQIRNQGYATAAQFFSHANDLFVIIPTDNGAHSLTTTPIHRWARTYMDQIHEIQTRGAVAVEAFPIERYTYIAIAQAQDAAGNYEVGTLILRMYGKVELEKVQLLWSIEPVSLSYVRVLEEHFLIVGQSRESSICYWFGGYDFLYWHSLDGLQGRNIYMDSLILPDREPLLLASTESSVALYTRVRNSQLREQISILNRTSVLYTATSGQTIVEAKFLKTFKEREPAPIVYLALTLQSYSGTQLKVYPLTLARKDIPGSQYKDPEDKVGNCLKSLKIALDRDEPSLVKLDSEVNLILTKSGDWDYGGSIVSQAAITFDGSRSSVELATIKPDLESAADKYQSPPSVTLERIERAISEFNYGIGKELGQVLLKSQPGNITGDLTFAKGLGIQNLNSYSKLQLDTLNGVEWQSLENDVLRSGSKKGQVVTGNWQMDQLKAESIQTGNRIGNVHIPDLLLTTCERAGYTETLQGKYTFAQDLDFVQGLALSPSAAINDIPFSNIALQSEQYPVIHGYKHAEYVTGGEGLTVDYLNRLKLSEWYDSVLKINGPDQTSTGTKTFTGELVIGSLHVDTLNGRNWDDFKASVLINGLNQTLHGGFNCGRLRANSLELETINGRYVNDWMTTTTNQVIRSDIHVGDLKIRKNLFTKSINGIRLSEAVLSTERDVEIRGPVQLQRFTVGNLSLAEYATINSIDISEAAKLRKKHIYSTAGGEDLYLDGNVGAGTLEAGSFNGIPFGSIRNAYWRADIDNEIQADFSFGNSDVRIKREFRTGTLNGLDLSSDVISTTRDNELIHGNLQFTSDVVVAGKVVLPDGVTLNDIDFSEIEGAIVRTTDRDRRIGGKKLFQDAIEVKDGLQVGLLNGLSLEKDLVFLSGYGTQEIYGRKEFQEVTAQDVIAESDVEVHGTVNGYKLKELAESTVYYDDEQVKIESDVVFSQSLTADDLYVKNEINNRKFSQIVAHVIRLDQAQALTVPLTIYGGTLTFSQASNVTLINGVALHEYLPKIVNKYTDITLQGTKEFQSVVIEGNLECTLINKINLQELEEYALSKTKEQTVSGKFTFEEVYSNGNLVAERIGGILLTDLVRSDEHSTINTDVIFRNKETKVEGKIYLNGLLNGYKIEEVAEGLTSLKGNRKFDSVTVEGNLSWEYSRENLRRLSYLFEYAVTISTPQTLTEQITFTNGFRANTIQALKWINGVDLVKIQEDSVYRNQPVTFTGENTFEHNLEVSKGSVTVRNHLNTVQINNIVLRDLYQKVVRIDSSRRIGGVKTFVNGFSTEKLSVYGTIDTIHPKDLVTINDTRVIDRIVLKYVSILGNLDYQSLEGFNLEELLAQRLTLDQAQKVYGDIVFEGDLIVQDCSVQSINGLQLADLFLLNSESAQVITGHKTFTDLRIEGDLENTVINGFGLDDIANQILRRGEDEVISRHVIFTDTVRISEYVNVSSEINNYYIDQVASAFTSRLEGIIQGVHASEETIQRATELILSLQKTQELKAVWLDYLRVLQEWYGLGSKSRVEYLVNGDDSSVIIALHQPIDGKEAGLPQGCHCNSIQFLELGPDYIARNLASVDCVNIFDLRSSSGSSYTIYSHVASYNNTCSKSETGTTYVSSMVAQEHRYKISHGGSVPIAEFSLGKFDSGYVRDVKVFSFNGKDYLVIAQYYDIKSRSHDAEVLVYEVGNGALRKVQGIPSKGATRLGLEYIDNSWTLVIGNTYKVKDEACGVDSSIYHWSIQSNQFVLIRDVKTIGLVDVSIIPIDKNGYFHESYIVIAENGEDGDFGKVSIYRYDSKGPTYFFHQTIHTKGPISAVYGFSLPQFSYLVIVTPADGLLFYHYRHAEGFRLQLTVPVPGALDTNAIVWKNKIFFPIVSSYGSINAQAVIEGVLEPKPLPQLSPATVSNYYSASAQKPFIYETEKY